MGYTLKEGNYEKLGVQTDGDACIFTFEGEKEDTCAVLLYGKNHEIIKRIPVPAEYCVGSLRSIRVEGLSARNLMYNYEINGKVMVDTYAKRIIGRERWNDTAREKHGYRIYGGIRTGKFDWQNDRPPELPGSQMFLYKLHVRGFSMDAGLRGKVRGTFKAVTQQIPYLKSLGVTVVELMPVYEFEEMVFSETDKAAPTIRWEEREGDIILNSGGAGFAKGHGRVNYWGYIPGNYFSVKASYGSTEDAAVEFMELVRELHKNRMECVMEIFFEERMNRNVILDALRFWVREYHVDGFHLLGNSVPVTAAAQDLILSRTKLFYGGFEPFLLEQQKKYRRLFVYNDDYLYAVRKMLNHMGGDMETFAGQQRRQHMVQGYVNYVANNNGFTLYDLFSYQVKHNEANGEDNFDGNDWNFSSNCGVEGKTTKRYVTELRNRQILNALTILFLAQGVPLLLGGDECYNSQSGNNNAYCQDNRIGWLNRKKGEKYDTLIELTSKLAAFRRAHPILSLEHPMELRDYERKGFPDLSYHGENAWISFFSRDKQAVGVMYCGAYTEEQTGSEDDFLYVGYNFYNGASTLALPKLPGKKKWRMVLDTSLGKEMFLDEEKAQEGQRLILKPQSVAVLVGR